MDEPDHTQQPHEKATLVRWTMVILGLISMAAGGIGVIVPGLPTTIFLIMASYFFARSCPPLDAWMRSSRMFKPYARYLDRRQPMPIHSIVWTMVFIWSGIGFSVYRLWSGLNPAMLMVGALALGSIASFSVVWWGRTSILRAQEVSKQ